MREREVQIRYQLRWVIVIAVAIVVASSTLLATLAAWLNQDLGSTYQQTFITLKNIEKVLVPLITLSVLIYLIVGSGIVVLVSIFISHRIAGPLYKMEQFAESLRRGELDFPMRLRKGDQIGLLAEALRDLQGTLANRLRSFGQALDNADRLWARLDAVDPEADAAGAREILARIERVVAEAEAGLGSDPDAPRRGA